MAVALVVFGDDLRLGDNPALQAALDEGHHVIPVYVWDRAGLGAEAPTGAARWWLHHALEDLDETLRERGSRMVFLKGNAAERIADLARQCGAWDVYWNKRCGGQAILDYELELEARLRAKALRVRVHTDAALHPPGELARKGGEPYRVFRPYYQAALKAPVHKSLGWEGPETLNPVHLAGDGPVDALGLETRLSWTSGIRKNWVPTHAGLNLLLNEFPSVVENYDIWRDIPYRRATSSLSPYLRFGQLSLCQLHERLLERCEESPGREAFERQLHWREFARQLIYARPDLSQASVDERFEAIQWRDNPEELLRWQEGRTGFPLVDAGMRQLWQTGWMHNRVRMVVGSFLVKDLLMDWRKGAEWFMDTLVDANVANNSFGWQWVAGCGADAAPYFRVFNPLTQSRSFDPEGHYIRRFIPELGALPNEWIHAPWEAPAEELEAAGITLGVDYPLPMLDHAQARRRALGAYAVIKGTSEVEA